MRALVTGATGFIGRHLVSSLREAGWEVVCAVRKPVQARGCGISCVRAELSQPDSLSFDPRDVGRIDVVFHLAAVLPVQGEAVTATDYVRANVLATIRLLAWAEEWAVPAFVYASSMSVIGKPRELPVTEDHPLAPLQPYTYSKLCGELYCEMVRRQRARCVTSLRICAPYGAGMPTATVLPLFVERALAGADLCYHGTGQRAQNFVHVRDIVRACLLAAETSNPGVYTIGGPETITMRALAQRIVALVPDCRSRVVPSGQPDPQESCRWEVDLTRAREGLGYAPAVALEAGLTEYIAARHSRQEPPRWWEAT